MLNEVSGLPAHVLLVHAVVVLVPLAALLVLVAAVWPAFRRRAGLAVPLIALVALVCVPLTTSAGEWLARRVPHTELVHHHEHLGDTLLPWAIGLFVVGAALWVMYRWHRSPLAEPNTGRRTTGHTVLQVTVAVLALVVSVGAVVQTYRIGESGARAAWQGDFHQNAIHGQDHHHDED